MKGPLLFAVCPPITREAVLNEVLSHCNPREGRALAKDPLRLGLLCEGTMRRFDPEWYVDNHGLNTPELQRLTQTMSQLLSEGTMVAA